MPPLPLSSISVIALFLAPTRALPPLRIPANDAASLASASLLNLGILPKADHGWRETHGPNFWFTWDWSATLPSHWAKQILGHSLLLGLSSHFSIALSYTHYLPHPVMQITEAVITYVCLFVCCVFVCPSKTCTA